ncbi:Cof-type HAD-IIB family hydrolase [[Clostridium] aminophilum]|uniref:Cof-type HAD-IIB family hydrolase n=1 Tax=[Clostridium] aminophilum TaxID=1526 RepID=UPI0026EBABD2|nr:HAD family hydrolase [[Clostridium] aminophilum]MDD6196799.1 HAD family hydrolase [[Clostridium] aminophilum]
MLVSFDLDMTLLDHKDLRIPDSALRALDLLRQSGKKIILATGRDMDTHYSRQYIDLIRPDAVIHMNGTKITAGSRLLYEHHFNRNLLRAMMTFCEERGYSIGMTYGDDDYYLNPEAVEANDLRRWGECGRHFRDPSALLTLPVRTLAFVGSPDQVKEMQKTFPNVRFPLFSSQTGADIVEEGCSKADGLVRLARYFGEDPSLKDAVAFGDSMNDIEVIRAVGTGIAMGNAVPELKEVADYITDPIGQDGIYNACRKFGLFEADFI